MIAHIGGVPLEEGLLAVIGGGAGLSAVRTWIIVRVRIRGSERR